MTLLVDAVPVRGEPDAEHPRGRVEGALAAFQDVTARHEAVRALHASERRLKATHDNAGVGLHEVDAEGRYLNPNYG